MEFLRFLAIRAFKVNRDTNILLFIVTLFFILVTYFLRTTHPFLYNTVLALVSAFFGGLVAYNFIDAANKYQNKKEWQDVKRITYDKIRFYIRGVINCIQLYFLRDTVFISNPPTDIEYIDKVINSIDMTLKNKNKDYVTIESNFMDFYTLSEQNIIEIKTVLTHKAFEQQLDANFIHILESLDSALFSLTQTYYMLDKTTKGQFDFGKALICLKIPQDIRAVLNNCKLVIEYINSDNQSRFVSLPYKIFS